MTYQIMSASLISNMIRAARLQGSLYAEIKANTTATPQAIAVVALVGLAHAVGASIRSVFLWSEEPVPAFVIALLAEIIFWAVAAFAIYLAGRFLFSSRAHYGQVLRSFGFACVPGLLILIAALVSLPGTGAEVPVFAVLIPWRVAAGFVAVRQVLSLGMVQSGIALLAGVVPGLMVVGIATGVMWTILS